ncbi:MAG: ankyrin repeat domain-containing protein [Proteobacteria bacterium]|nr:ankyrin repeat domain-containing protein [Pseudomonadota bacterium]
MNSPGIACLALLLLTSHVVAGDDLLIEAIQNADHATLLSLLDRKDIDVNGSRGDGSTALSWAAYEDDEIAIDLLIRAGADVNVATDFHAVTPLALVCANGNSGAVAKLLAAGADPNIANRGGETPLMACANTGAEEGIRALLKRGADVNAKEGKDDQTALMWAAAEKHPQVVRALVKNGANVAARSRLVAKPDPYIVEISLDQSIWGSNYPDTTRWQKQSGGFTALYFAAQAGDIDSAQILLEAGAEIDAPHVEWGSALNITIASGHEDFALFLLEQGADPNISDAWGVSPLHYALYKGLMILNRWKPTDSEHLGWERENMPGLIAALLERGAEPGARIRYSYPYMEHMFIARSNDLPPQVSPVGAIALHLAAVSGDVESMRILQPVSDPKATTIGGGTVFLLTAGAGVEKKARNGENAVAAAKLALAMGGGDVNDYLTDRIPGGPRPDLEDLRTALHFAAYLGWNDMIEFLVEQGADIDAGDRYGATPLMIALGDPEGRYYRQVGEGSYDLRFRRPGSTPGTGENMEVAELLLTLGAEPFTGEYRDVSGL